MTNPTIRTFQAENEGYLFDGIDHNLSSFFFKFDTVYPSLRSALHARSNHIRTSEAYIYVCVTISRARVATNCTP